MHYDTGSHLMRSLDTNILFLHRDHAESYRGTRDKGEDATRREQAEKPDRVIVK